MRQKIFVVFDMRNVLMIKTLIGKTKFYEYLRSAWYRHLREIPRKRLRRFGPQAINVVYDTLSAQGVEYWVDFGTAIGMIRDSGFIKHDDDIDFSLMAGAITPLNLYKTLSNCKQFSFSHA